MEHLGDLEDVEDIAQSLVQTIQTTLIETVFSQSPVQ
jgi:hypothetical protein